MNPKPMHTTIDVPLTIKSLPIRHGLSWFKNALRLIQAKPLLMMLTSAWIIFIELMLTRMDASVGTALFLLIGPVLAFGVADLCQNIRLQNPSSPLSIFEPFFYPIRTPLMMIGIVTGAIIFALVTLGQRWIDESSLSQIFKQIAELGNINNINDAQTQYQSIRQNLIQNKTSLIKLALLMLSTTILQIIFSYAPLFAVWQNMEPIKAITLSIITILRNLLPLTLTLILIGMCAIVIATIAGVLGAIAPVLLTFVLMSAWIGLNALINGIVYTSYYDIIKYSLTISVHEQIDHVLNEIHEPQNTTNDTSTPPKQNNED